MDFPLSIKAMIADSHGAAVAAGWYTDIKTGQPKVLDRGQRLMLIVSELSEAMEGDRKSLMDDKLPHRSMLEAELADTVIRIADFAGAEKLNLEAHFALMDNFQPDPNTAAALMDCVVSVAWARDVPEDAAPHLACALRQIFDLADALKLDLGGAYTEKRAFNDNREDHKMAARLAPGGKDY